MVGPLATTQESVKIWTLDIPLLWDSFRAQVTNPWVPSFIKDALVMGQKEAALHWVLSHVMVMLLSVT